MTTNAIVRNSHGLKAHLFDQLDRLEEGKTTPQHLRSVAAMANSILGIVRVEMEYARFVTEQRSEGGGLPALPMGLNLAPPTPSHG